MCAKLGQVNLGAYGIGQLGSQLSRSSTNLVPAKAGKVTVGLESHWHRGLSTYGLKGQRQGDKNPCICPFGAWHYLPIYADLDPRQGLIGPKTFGAPTVFILFDRNRRVGRESIFIYPAQPNNNCWSTFSSEMLKMKYTGIHTYECD